MGDVGPIRGYLVRKVGQKQSALGTYHPQQGIWEAKTAEASYTSEKEMKNAEVWRYE